MKLTLKPFATPGIALASAGAIAVAPMSIPPFDITATTPRSVSTSVEMSALTDGVVDPWIAQFNTASANVTRLVDAYFRAPGPALQQVIVNQAAYVNTVLNDPGSIDAVLQSIGTNAQKVLEGLTYIGLDSQTFALGRRLLQSNDYLHSIVAQYLPLYLPADMDPQTVQIAVEVVKLLATPLSGVLIGFAGPIVSPAVALLNSMQAIADGLATDPSAALQTLMTTPANVVGAFFNGATLDLSPVLPLINGSMPEGTSIGALSVAFGGLLTPGFTAQSPAGESPIGGPGSIGGSIFNSIGATVTTPMYGQPSVITISANPVGPLGALTKLSQIVARELGWDGTGNPLTKLKFPEIDQNTTPDTAQRQRQWATTMSRPMTTSQGNAGDGGGASTDSIDAPGPAATLNIRSPHVPAVSTGNRAVLDKADGSTKTRAAKLVSGTGLSHTVKKFGERFKMKSDATRSAKHASGTSDR